MITNVYYDANSVALDSRLIILQIRSHTEADLICRQCLTEGINCFRKLNKLPEFSDLFGIAILLSVHVSYVASLCVSLYTYGLHW